MFVSLPSLPHYTDLDQLHSAIWCKIFIVQEGYIPYLKKWSRQQQFADIKSSRKHSQEEGEVHSDVQWLVLSGPPRRFGDSPEVANSVVKDIPLEPGLASHQSQLTRSRCDEIQMKHIGVKEKQC